MASMATFTTLAVLAASAPGGFSVGIELPNQVPVSPAVEAALAEMGIDYVNFYVNTVPWAGDLPAAETYPALRGLCERLGLDYSIACHMFEPPEDIVAQAVGDGRFQGVVFDELEHVAVINHYGLEGMVDSARFTELEAAYETTLGAYTDLVRRYEAVGSPVTATHVFPVLVHLAARSGAIPCPKICKETYSPISLAIGLGAAKQYGRPLWVDCDLWFWDLVPGHDAEEFRSNLLLAYWMGADRVYVEGAGFNLHPSGRAGIPFSLMSEIHGDTHQLTPHGEVLRWFAKQYLPTHPRPYTFRDITPQVAIVRFEDTCWGQRYSGWEDKLYGSPSLVSNADTEAWLGLWNALTCGVTGRDGLMFFRTWSAPYGYERPVQEGVAVSYVNRPVQAAHHPFWVPLSGAVVYDHTVGYELLAGVPLICVTGTRVSDETWAAVERRVQEGAVCLCWAPLARDRGLADAPYGVTVIQSGSGRWVLTDDFGFGQVYQEIWPWVGHPDEIRYRFGREEIVLRRAEGNAVRVERYTGGASVE